MALIRRGLSWSLKPWWDLNSETAWARSFSPSTQNGASERIPRLAERKASEPRLKTKYTRSPPK